MNETTPVEIKKPRQPIVLVIVIVGLAAIFALGLRWIIALPREAIGSAPFLLFDYAVGLTMIFLPCTLPLAFVIVPLAMGRSYRKGIGMAIAFGAGVAVTLGVYGLLIGLLGKTLGVHQVETAKNILYAIAGTAALTFALGDLGLLRAKAPSLNLPVPAFILRQKDLLKAGLMGLFLGNVGVGCPNPLFNAVIIPQIVVTGSPLQGFVIMFVQALGRVTPLLILAFLAILGVNATSFLVKHKDTVARATGWVTVFIGGFLLVLGLFGHDWWVLSGQHTLFELLTQENAFTELLGQKLGELGHTHGLESLVKTGLFGLPIRWGTPVLLFLWTFPMFWYWRKQKRIGAAPPLLGWFFVALATLLVVVFGWVLPHQFAAHWSKMHVEPPPFHLEVSTWPGPAIAGRPFDLVLKLHDDEGEPIRDLEVSHEKILHVVLVSEDLEEFKHVHPDETAPVSPEAIQEGEFRVPLILSQPGRYRVLVDGMRQGQEVFDLGWLDVGGPKRAVRIEKDLGREKVFSGYQVVLKTDPAELKSGSESHLMYDIQRFREAVTVEDYLGADMHLAIMSADLSTVIHTHGAKENNLIDAHFVFPFAGLWKIYGQFQHRGQVVTTEFMVEVLPGEDDQAMPHVD